MLVVIKFKIVNEDKSMSGFTELFADSGDDRLGYAFLEARPNGELYLELVLTFPPYRKKGVGSALLVEIERYGRAKGFARVAGEVFSNDYTTSPDAVDARAQWFKGHGFEINQVPGRGWNLLKTL